ncbi:MAG: helix-turn-helix transcriptional regulator [Oscillospiraceae bacterium]|nr:helix-turn-helix transcriptional regulator [Oscillospiraceae bacterium]
MQLTYLDGPTDFDSGRPYICLRVKSDYPLNHQQIRWHDSPLLMQVVDGEAEAWLSGRRYKLHAGDVVYLSGGTMYAIDMRKGNVDFLYINPQQLGEISAMRALLEDGKLPYLCFKDDGGDMINNLHNIFANIILSDRYMDVWGTDLRQTILSYTEGSYTLAEPLNDAPSARHVGYLRTALSLIHEHLFEQLTLEQLASSVGLSSKYFCRFFQEMTGQKPFEHINSLRIERACEMFIRDKVTVKAVSAEVGFKDINYFIKTFYRFRGMTPKKFATQYYRFYGYMGRY